jgi:hypothetical protein
VKLSSLFFFFLFSLSVFATILRFKFFQSRKFAYMLMSELGIRAAPVSGLIYVLTWILRFGCCAWFERCSVGGGHHEIEKSKECGIHTVSCPHLLHKGRQ